MHSLALILLLALLLYQAGGFFVDARSRPDGDDLDDVPAKAIDNPDPADFHASKPGQFFPQRLAFIRISQNDL